MKWPNLKSVFQEMFRNRNTLFQKAWNSIMVIMFSRWRKFLKVTWIKESLTGLLSVNYTQGRNSTPNPSYGKTRLIKAEAQQSGYQLVLDRSEKEEYKALGAVWNPYMGERCEGNAS